MNRALDDFLSAWPFEPWALAGVVVCVAVYWRGWRSLRRGDPTRWGRGQLAAFLGGQVCLLLALASPIEVYSGRLLQVHMVQHLLLMMAAPPLIWLGEPLFPFLRGLPDSVVSCWVAPLYRSPGLQRVFAALTHPVGAGVVLVAATWAWHMPVLYELALRSEGWHYVQHAFFLGAGLLFWHPVVRPYPARPRWSPWLLLPLLLLADVQNTALSALLTFADQPWYSSYAVGPRPWGVTALEDQATAGVLMWVPGSLIYLLPLFGVGVRLMFGALEPVEERRSAPLLTGRIALPLVPPLPAAGAFDLLRVPLLGRFLRWRHARLALQLPLLILAALVIYDGLAGPASVPRNLAGVLPWVHWRGLVAVGLLAVGNVFCTACPFMLPRKLARVLLPARWAWPRWLRGKWPALALLLVFLWAYEAFALWDSPWLTAWIALGYFAAALLIDGLFQGASFCKHVCPIGQFNFVGSLLSPLEVKVRDPSVCASCRTKDCIRGRDGVSGCETGLYLPRKAGNLDCTGCLDCVHACPHDNVGVLAVTPGAELVRDPQRSGIGRFGRRRDLAALVLLLVFGAFANAAGMVGPVVMWQEQVTARAGWSSLLPAVSVFYLLALVVIPLLLVGGAAVLARRWGRLSGKTIDAATRYAFALVPLGFAMWLTHYGFHLLTSYDGVVPVTQRFFADLGWAGLGEPDWRRACCVRPPEWLHDLELLFLFAGLLGSLHAARLIARNMTGEDRRAWLAFLPWAVLALLLFAAGAWIALQPMQMRGTLSL